MVNSPQKLKRIEQKVQSHADSLLLRHIPDLAHARTKFAGGYSKSTFIASHLAQTPAEREAANLLSAAWDAGMNDLNEILRNAYGLVHGYRRIGPGMPLVYAEPELGLSRRAELESVNEDRNLLTHDYPALVAGDLFEAIEQFSRIVKPTLQEAKAFALTHGVDIRAVPRSSSR